MSRSGPTIAILLVACGAAAAGAPPGFHHEVLPNGLAVSVLEDPALAVVATQVWYHVGAAEEDRSSRGLAHLFEHMMFGPNARYGKEAYSRYHTRHGGEENAYTSSDETVYVSEIAPEFFLPVLDMEAARMRGLVIDAANLENEKRIVTEELRLRTENDPISRAFITAQQAVFGEHPYAFDPTGSKDDVAAATVEACRRFYDRHYQPENAHLVVVGPIDAREVLAEVRARFGPVPAGRAEHLPIPALVDWKFPAEPIVVVEDLPPVETAVVAFPLPPAEADERSAIDVLEQLLAGGAVDPFREEIVVRRERAIEAGVESFDFRQGGALLFYAVSLPYRRQSTAFEHVAEAIDRIAALDWLTPDSLAAAKRSLLRRKYDAGHYAAVRAAEIGSAAWWLADPRRAFEIEERIRAVTLDQVAATWRRYIVQGTPVRVYTKPEKVPLAVRLFGWVYPLVN